MIIIHHYNLKQVNDLINQIKSTVSSTTINLNYREDTNTQNHHEHEIWFIQSGIGLITSNHQKQIVRAGDLILFKPFEHHHISNLGKSNLSFISYWYTEMSEVNNYIGNLSNLPSKKVRTTPQIIFHNQNNKPLSKLFSKILNFFSIPCLIYNIDKLDDIDFSLEIRRLEELGRIHTKTIQYPYDEQSKKFIDIEELSGKCRKCQQHIQGISCHHCGYFHWDFEILEPRKISNGIDLTTLALEILYLSIDQSFIKDIMLSFEQSDDYSSMERELLCQLQQNNLNIPITCFSKQKKLTQFNLNYAGPKQIIPEIYSVFLAGGLYRRIFEKTDCIVFIKLSQFYIFTFVYHTIISLFSPIKPSIKIKLDETYIPYTQTIKLKTTDIDFLKKYSFLLNEELSHFSYISPEPGQWTSKDIFFIQDIQQCIKRFFYFSQTEQFNMIEIKRIRKKMMLEISAYFSQLKHINKQINDRHYRTVLSLCIFSFKWLIGISNVCVNSNLNLDIFDLDINNHFDYGQKINFLEIIEQLNTITS